MAADPPALDRLVTGLAVSLALGGAGYLARTLTFAGLAAAVAVGAAVWTGQGGRGFAVLAAFFLLASGLTRLGYRRKAAEGLAESRGGRRGAGQVLANGGVASAAALAGVVVPSATAAAPALTVAFVAAFATAAADTAGTEVGQLLGRRTYLVTTWRPVARGSDGGVSLPGSLASAFAAVVVAAVGAWVGLYPWHLAPIPALAGFLGAAADSLLGATLERRGHLDNDRVNLLATAAGGLLALALAWIVLSLG